MWLDISIVAVPGNRRDLSTTVHLFRDVTASREIEALVRERLTQIKLGSPNGDAPPVELTRRELEVLRLLTGGADTKVMAERLHVSPATVRNHVQNIFGKLGVHSRLEAVAYANRNGLL
ncbi:MAG: response regulator transcription factor [Candidatus Rokubacteria bacterium]|nr:response regulator transcription factor [Candidatus Rokubacteria bacterium]